MSSAYIALLAIGLDLLIGDPRKLPHITRFTGTAIAFWEGRFRKAGFDGILAGCVFLMFVALSVVAPLCAVYFILSLLHPVLGDALLVLIVYQSIAFRDLVKHVKAVLLPLKKSDLPQARKRVAWIVGRDTESLDQTEVSRAAIEALAESANDGVFAPLFWSLALGPWGALLYRISNTLDSMVGHRDARYEKFGKASARLDDLLGYLPARITALLYWLTRPRGNLAAIIRDARQHASPNAGWPEATIAHSLNIRLGGTNRYDGELHHGPIFNPTGHAPSPQYLQSTLRMSYTTITIAVFLIAGIILL